MPDAQRRTPVGAVAESGCSALGSGSSKPRACGCARSRVRCSSPRRSPGNGPRRGVQVKSYHHREHLLQLLAEKKRIVKEHPGQTRPSQQPPRPEAEARRRLADRVNPPPRSEGYPDMVNKRLNEKYERAKASEKESALFDQRAAEPAAAEQELAAEPAPAASAAAASAAEFDPFPTME